LGFSLVHVWFSKKEFEFQRLITLFSKYLLWDSVEMITNIEFVDIVAVFCSCVTTIDINPFRE
jgi:hypothetical protein